MKIFELVWQECPHNQHPKRVARVEAQRKEDAELLLLDAIRGKGIDWFTIHNAYEYKAPTVEGRVLSLEEI
jgi:hypothetical protein